MRSSLMSLKQWANTLEILDKVETYSINHGPIMPFFPIPEDFGTEEEWEKEVH